MIPSMQIVMILWAISMIAIKAKEVVIKNVVKKSKEEKRNTAPIKRKIKIGGKRKSPKTKVSGSSTHTTSNNSVHIDANAATASDRKRYSYKQYNRKG